MLYLLSLAQPPAFFLAEAAEDLSPDAKLAEGLWNNGQSEGEVNTQQMDRTNGSAWPGLNCILKKR